MQDTIDLNADVGEQPAALLDGREAALIAKLTSANIACGGHAGDATTMAAVIDLCKQHGVAIGAHPSYPDRAHFGRQSLDLAAAEIERCVAEQVAELVRLAVRAGVRVRHLKPHGALYNQAATDAGIAIAIAEGARRVDPQLRLVGLAGSRMLEVWRDAGFTVAGEAFADRRYEGDGSLRPRRFADAVITDPEAAAQQALELVRDGTIRAVDGTFVTVQAATLCLHGDTENAVDIATAVRARLLGAGVRIARLG